MAWAAPCAWPTAAAPSGWWASVEDPDDLTATTIVLRTGALPRRDWRPRGRTSRWLVATPGPLTWARSNSSTRAAWWRCPGTCSPTRRASRAVSVDGDEGSELAIIALIGGLAMLEVVLLAGPAFAVGARRRRRDLALVAAVGGTPAHLRRIVLADGVVLGVLAAVAGVVVGVAVAAGTHSMFERLADSRSGAFRVFPVALAVLCGLAVVTGVLAALVPAWMSSRQDVVPALAGRRGVTRSRRRWPILGAVLGVLGAVVAVGGAWWVEAAIILAGWPSPSWAWSWLPRHSSGLLARLGRWLPLAPRIALRDTSRNRTAAAPAISAVMAAVIGSLAAGVILGAILIREKDARRVGAEPAGRRVPVAGREG